MRKFLLFFSVLTLLIVSTLSIAAAESEAGDNNTWGFGSSMPSFGNLQMPEMPSMNQDDWWGSFSAPDNWGKFDFGNFSQPITGEWGTIGNEGSLNDMSSAFDDFKNNTLGGLNQESKNPLQSNESSELEDAFNAQKNNIQNAGSDSSNVRDLFGSVFGDSNKYTPVENKSLPITYSQVQASNGSLPKMNTGAYDQISSLASVSKISNIMSSAQKTASTSASLSNLPQLGFGESADEHQASAKDISGLYGKYASGLKINIEEASSGYYKGLYATQKASLKKK